MITAHGVGEGGEEDKSERGNRGSARNLADIDQNATARRVYLRLLVLLVGTAGDLRNRDIAVHILLPLCLLLKASFHIRVREGAIRNGIGSQQLRCLWMTLRMMDECRRRI